MANFVHMESQAIEIGDKVRFLNEVGEGTVTQILSGTLLMVEDQNGFEFQHERGELILIGNREEEKAGVSAGMLALPMPPPSSSASLVDQLVDTVADLKSPKRQRGHLLKIGQDELADLLGVACGDDDDTGDIRFEVMDEDEDEDEDDFWRS